MPKIIISYRRADSGVITGRIRDRLAQHYGDDAIFMDIDNIPFGMDFRKNIAEALAKNERLTEHCIEINRLEEVADQLVRSAVSDLFQNEKDPIQILKLKEIYEFLEQTTDACEDVADALQNVTVKNS